MPRHSWSSWSRHRPPSPRSSPTCSPLTSSSTSPCATAPRWCWPGPNSVEIEGTDVLAARTDPEAASD